MWHMEIPKLGGELELQLLAYVTAIATPDPSRVCANATACGNAGSLTTLMRPGIEPMSLWILVRFVAAEPQGELTILYF